MKKIITLLFFLSLFSTNICFSQSGWFWQNPLPQGNNLQSIKFIDLNTGWAAGLKGTIIKSTDGGLNWTIQQSQVYSDLFNLYIISQSTVFIIGAQGKVLMTTNGGTNWTITQLNVNCKFTGIYFNNELSGWISGFDNSAGHGIIYKTTNGGTNWYINFTSPYDDRFTIIQFINNFTGWVGGGWSCFRTTNGGENWNNVNQIIMGNDLYFRDSLNGIFAGAYFYGSTLYGTIRRTTNGGYNLASNFTFQDTALNSISFANLNTGYVAGQKGKILKTTNFGINWNSIQSGTLYELNSIFLFDSLKGWTAGFGGTIMKSDNGFLNVQQMNKGKPYINLSSVCFENENTGWVCGENTIMKTTNGGDLWLTKWDSNGNMNALFFINGFTGWAVCSPYTAPNNIKIFKSTDGGNIWNFVSSINVEYPGYSIWYNIHSIFFTNGNTGWMAGSKLGFFPPHTSIYQGAYFKTTNGGLNFTIYVDNNSEVLFDVKFSNPNTGWLVGDNQIIYKTTNGGNDWFLQQGAYSSGFTNRKVFFANETTGWIMGYFESPRNSSITKTTNGGLNWQPQITFSNTTLTSLFFYNSNYGWTSEGQNIYATSNSGLNWYYQPTPSTNNINSIFFMNSYTGWAVGNLGTIIKTVLGVMPNELSEIKNNLPLTIKLSQNYPNPFNPVTKIKYDIPPSKGARGMMTKLIIYDVLGREIETLVNETQKPGSYEVTWDGSLYASGVYFYRLIMDEYTETKKMVLIK